MRTYQNTGVVEAASTQQLSLFDTPDTAKSRSILESFRAFHARNPHVYLALRERARQHVEAGARYLSVKLLVEEVRTTLRTDDSPYRINNNYTSLYARLLETEPWMPQGVLRTRTRRAA